MVYAQPRIQVGNKSTSREHPHYGIIKIGQNTEKSPADLKRFVVTQTPVENYQLTLMRKNLITIIISAEKDWLQPPERILTERGPTERQK